MLFEFTRPDLTLLVHAIQDGIEFNEDQRSKLHGSPYPEDAKDRERHIAMIERYRELLADIRIQKRHQVKR